MSSFRNVIALVMLVACERRPLSGETRESDDQFRRWDRDSDGQLTMDEFPYRTELFFELAGKARSVDRVAFRAGYRAMRERIDAVVDEPHGWFALYDRDADKALRNDDLKHVPHAKEMLLTYDLDADGVITEHEVEQRDLPPHRWRPFRAIKRMQREFAKRDANRDGLLDATETRSFLLQWLDANADGKLARAELDSATALERLGPDALRDYAADNELRRLDADRNGALDNKELAERLLSRLDVDHDGSVSSAEYRSIREARRADAVPLVVR